MGMIVIAFLANELLNKIFGSLVVSVLRLHDGTFKAQAKTDGYAVRESIVERLPEVIIVKFGEEPERSQGEREYRWDYPLKKPASIEDSTVTAELEDSERVKTP